MATLLDVGLLKGFSSLFPFLLVLVITYAVLSFVKPFKENQALAVLAAIALAFMTMFFPIAYKTIMLMSPWFVLLLIFFMFILIAYQAFGIKEETILSVITGKGEGPVEYSGTFGWWVLALVIIIAIGSLSHVVSQERGFTALTEEGMKAEQVVQPGSETATFFGAITHPKVLGMALVLMIAMFAVKVITERWEV